MFTARARSAAFVGSEKGGSFVSLLLVLGVGGAFALGLAQLINHSYAAMRAGRQTAEIDRLTSLARLALSSSDVCRYNFTTNDEGIAAVIRMPLLGETVALSGLRPIPSALADRQDFLSVDRTTNDVRIKRIELRRWGESEEDAVLSPDLRLAELAITFIKLGRTIGGRTDTRRIPVALEVNNRSEILSCRAPGETHQRLAANDSRTCLGEYVEIHKQSGNALSLSLDRQHELQRRKPVPLYRQVLAWSQPKSSRDIASERPENVRVGRVVYQGLEVPIIHTAGAPPAVPVFEEGDSISTVDRVSRCLSVHTCIHSRMAITGVSCPTPQVFRAANDR